MKTDAGGTAVTPQLVAGAQAGPVVVSAVSVAVPAVPAVAFTLAVQAAGPSRADVAVSLSAPATVTRGAPATVTVTATNAGRIVRIG